MTEPRSPGYSQEELPVETERLDIGHLGQQLKKRRGQLSIRKAAAEAGVSFSTWSRIEAGGQPDLATFTLLCAWLGVSPARFFNPVTEREMSPLDQAIGHLQTDPRLTDDAAAKISSMLRDMYEALARNVAPTRPPIACHLRAASVMRPGAPQRLAGILGDIHEALTQKIEAGEL
ncbi:XRE family transcriptional regulator [Actinomadura darangshiensis]|jgi:transcriptional regulator with XRE-family HTH domain|uniref:XRE family transcriptional regulator n=1 Tax=Actinomadura darangshiensis TaxID=705336 RepID=A0A4R5BN90_9ACTN|nr:helix-turn-helix transcriptional regulator [Actinomadura darangshiensis]TDD87339.1 XRE family transcriptional regulator [Actinomadura darangshiensis]